MNSKPGPQYTARFYNRSTRFASSISGRSRLIPGLEKTALVTDNPAADTAGKPGAAPAAARAAGQQVIDIELALERHVGLWDTAAMPALFEAGRRAAQAQLPRIIAALERLPFPTHAPQPAAFAFSTPH